MLDLDETLVHSSLDTASDPHFTFPVVFGGRSHSVSVRRRPHLAGFLERVASLFEVVVFTASQKVMPATSVVSCCCGWASLHAEKEGSGWLAHHTVCDVPTALHGSASLVPSCCKDTHTHTPSRSARAATLRRWHCWDNGHYTVHAPADTLSMHLQIYCLCTCRYTLSSCSTFWTRSGG